MSKHRKRYKLRFTPLTPIHIGTGDEIDPLEYVIQNSHLYRLNLPAMIESLDESKRKEFLSILDGSNMVAVRKFVRSNIDFHVLYKTVTTKFVMEEYHKNNDLCIYPMYRRLDTWQAVIPGSSIKGAIRTAILSQDRKVFDYLTRIEPKEDPFRTVLIEDLTLSEEAIVLADTRINYQTSPYIRDRFKEQFYEMTRGYLNKNDLKNLSDAERKEKLAGIGRLILLPGVQQRINTLEIDAEKITSCCLEFYQKRMEEEHNKYHQRRSGEGVCTVSTELRKMKYGDFEFPIRLGHFSHCESMTVDFEENGKPIRKIRTRDGTGVPHTRTLARGEFPMGWAKISLIPINDAEG